MIIINKTVVIACNTATAAALQYLQHQFDIPIIGVITAGAKQLSKLLKIIQLIFYQLLFFSAKAYAKESTLNLLLMQKEGISRRMSRILSND